MVQILEPNASGHRLYYVRVLAEALSGSTVEWLTSPEAAISREAEVHLSEVLDRALLRCVQIDSWQQRRKVLRDVNQADHLVIIPDGDRWLPVLLWRTLLTLGVPRRASYRVLCIRPPLEASGGGRVLAKLRGAAKSLLIRAIACLNSRSRAIEIFSLVDSFGFTADWVPVGTSPVADPVMPRELPSRAQARQHLGIAEDILVVGLLGVIDQRKNPEMVAAGCVTAFRHMNGLLLVAGQMAVEVVPSDSFAALSGSHQLHVEDRYLSEDELGVAAAACDAVALMYDNHASASGVLSLAAQAGAAVIVPRRSRLARIARAGGFAIESSFSGEDFARSLQRVASERDALSSAALHASSRLGIADFVTRLTE